MRGRLILIYEFVFYTYYFLIANSFFIGLIYSIEYTIPISVIAELFKLMETKYKRTDRVIYRYSIVSPVFGAIV